MKGHRIVFVLMAMYLAWQISRIDSHECADPIHVECGSMCECDGMECE